MDTTKKTFPRYYTYMDEHDHYNGQFVKSQEEIEQINIGVEKRRKIIKSRLHLLDPRKTLAEQFKISMQNYNVNYFEEEFYGNLFDHYIVNNNHTFKLEDIPAEQLEDIFSEMVNLPKENKYLYLPLFQKWIKQIISVKASLPRVSNEVEIKDPIMDYPRNMTEIVGRSNIHPEINHHYFNHPRMSFEKPVIRKCYGYTIIEQIDKGKLIDLSS